MQWKSKLSPFELFTFYLSSSAKLKTHFFWRENLRKCTSFEDRKGTINIQWNVYFDIIVFSIFLL